MLSVCLTSHNRSDLTIESFSKVYDHPLISEIVIVDDHSDHEHYTRLLALVMEHKAFEKIKLFRNASNLGMSKNKAESVRKASNQWCILFDSDNILYPEYIKAIPRPRKRRTDIIYCPIAAEPDYDFSDLPSLIGSGNAKFLLRKKSFRVFLNTCNYVVNRGSYLEIYQPDDSIKESDTIYFNHLWMKASRGFEIVPGMKYFHRRHEGSGWLQGDHEYNLKKADELQKKIAEL